MTWSNLGRTALLGLILGLAACEQPERLDVLLITLDTTRADRLGCYGYEAIETPAIDGLARSGTRYDRAYTPVPITLPAHTSIFTGTLPMVHGVRANHGFYVPPEAQTLAEILRAEGYATAAFVGAFPLDSQTGIDQGFDHYDDNYPSSLDSGRHPRLRRFFDERPAAEVSRAALAWLKDAGERPYFLWAHYFDPHQPLQPPSPYRDRYAASPYDGEIASVDEAVGQILNWLEAQGRLERTLVVLTADHGEGLGEHGEQTHALLLYSSTLRVPLIVRDPRDLQPIVVSEPVSTVDIFPTILQRLGLTVPTQIQGLPLPRSDAGAPERREIYSETLYGRLVYGWSPLQRLTTRQHSLIRGPELELYAASDVPEKEELGDLRPRETRETLERLGRLRRRLAATSGDTGFSRGRSSDEARERLASLGYSASASTAVDSDEVDASRADPRNMMQVFDLDMEAGTHLDQGAFELAVPTYERALALDPFNPSLQVSLARAHLRRGASEEARVYLERAMTLEPQNVVAHLMLASHLRSVGEGKRAYEVLERVVAIDPEDLASRLQLAHLAEDLGDMQRSEAIYGELLDRWPDHAPALNGLGTLLYRRGDTESARVQLERALSLQPFYAPAWLNLAVIAFDQGEHRQAHQLVERALDLWPDYAQARSLAALIQAALANPTGLPGE